MAWKTAKVRVRGGHYAVGAQVVLDPKDRSADDFNPFDYLWEILAKSSSLRKLKIIFNNYAIYDAVQQV